jgi:tetratricopeptide (TPR) repeat protein
MKRALLCFSLAVFFVSGLFFLPRYAAAEDAKASVPDKALCAEMIRFGIQSYQRGKYLDAKEHFRKAVQADPSSTEAWRHYDLAVIYALAEKINKNTGLIAPDVSPGGPAKAASASPPPPPKEPAAAKKPKFVIVEDEGC